MISHIAIQHCILVSTTPIDDSAELSLPPSSLPLAIWLEPDQGISNHLGNSELRYHSSRRHKSRLLVFSYFLLETFLYHL